jgi:acylphosphatase
MDSGDTTKRMRVIFSGRVQGIGFRYTVCRVAESFAIAGYVRNLPGGDVELVAEGTEQELVDFLNGIRGAPTGRYVNREQVRWTTASGKYDRFGISF